MKDVCFNPINMLEFVSFKKSWDMMPIDANRE
ncbi:unnamed protein product, partial [marine sediment metagenome]